MYVLSVAFSQLAIGSNETLPLLNRSVKLNYGKATENVGENFPDKFNKREGSLMDFSQQKTGAGKEKGPI